jgi:hypothetical protein
MALAKEYANIILDITKKAVAEFQPYQKMIAALLPKIIAVIKGENVSFTDEELALLKQAAAAAQRFQEWSKIFGGKSKTSLATMLDTAKNIITAAEKHAEPYIAEEQKKRQEKLEQRKKEQKVQIDKAKANVNNLQANHKVAVDKYNADFAAYQEELKKYNALPDKKKQKAPVAPKNPDETLLDGVTLTEIYAQLEMQMAEDSPNNTKDENDHKGINSALVNKGLWYCGPSASTNVVMNYNPEGYVKAVIELATEGETQFRPDSPKIKLPKYVEKADAGKIKDFIGKRQAVDLIFGNSLRETENSFLKKSTPKNWTLHQGTMPWEVDDLLIDCGIELDAKRYYKKKNIDDLAVIEKAVAEGLLPIIFDNHKISDIAAETNKFGIIGIHYTTVHEFKVKGSIVEYKFWEYGYVSQLKSIPVKDFLKGMKSYWIPARP